MLTFSGVVMILFSALTITALFRIRRRQEDLHPKNDLRRGVFRSPGFPWTALLFIGVSAWILAVSFGTRPRESFAGLLVTASGIPFYFYWMHRKAFSWVWMVLAAAWFGLVAAWSSAAGYAGVSAACIALSGILALSSGLSGWIASRSTARRQ